MLDCSTMPDEGWDIRHEGRCYFYPGRDCPGWHEGGMCGRILEPIPEDVTKEGEDMDTKQWQIGGPDDKMHGRMS